MEAMALHFYSCFIVLGVEFVNPQHLDAMLIFWMTNMKFVGVSCKSLTLQNITTATGSTFWIVKNNQLVDGMISLPFVQI